MDHSQELRDFLRSRRARLEPADVGLEPETTGRRVPGLRREELAVISGISADYYARLEQGRARNVSDQVVDALARALRLDEVEREHLRRLTGPPARQQSGAGPRSRAQVVPPEIRSMIEALDPTPALVHNSMLDVLAANTMAGVLLDGLLDMPAARRNLARWTFLRPEARRVFVDWETSARHMTSTLRTAAAQSDDDGVHALIGELSVGSPEFSSYWAQHELTQPAAFGKRFHNSVVGEFDLHYQSLVVPQATDQYVALYTPTKGTPSAEAFALLASWTAGSAKPSPAGRPAAARADRPKASGPPGASDDA